MPNNYELLKETYTVVNRVEDKLDKLESRVSNLEIWKAQVIGQFMVIIAVINFAVAVSFDWIKKTIFGNRI